MLNLISSYMLIRAMDRIIADRRQPIVCEDVASPEAETDEAVGDIVSEQQSLPYPDFIDTSEDLVFLTGGNIDEAHHIARSVALTWVRERAEIGILGGIHAYSRIVDDRLCRHSRTFEQIFYELPIAYKAVTLFGRNKLFWNADTFQFDLIPKQQPLDNGVVDRIPILTFRMNYHWLVDECEKINVEPDVHVVHMIDCALSDHRVILEPFQARLVANMVRYAMACIEKQTLAYEEDEVEAQLTPIELEIRTGTR